MKLSEFEKEILKSDWRDNVMFKHDEKIILEFRGDTYLVMNRLINHPAVRSVVRIKMPEGFDFSLFEIETHEKLEDENG